jgi:hypothetical protein
MSYDLRIHFIGLALYVPEDGKAMHVLLPSTDEHVHAPGAPGGAGAPAGTPPVEKHFARIVFDKAYVAPDQTQLTREYMLVNLEGRLLDLSGLPASGVLNPTLTDELASMDRVAEPVPRTRVTELPDSTLAGRVTMDAGALTDYEMGALWRLNGGSPQRMAVGTEWTIRGIRSRKPAAEGGALYLPGRLLPGAQDPTEIPDPLTDQRPKLPDLYPVGETIHLMVFHTVASQFPPGGAFDVRKADTAIDKPDHFLAYYAVCPKKSGVTAAGELPVATDPARVPVEGAIVPLAGPQNPSFGCVHMQASLASV